MGKYNIISKQPKGNKMHENYTVTYQVNNSPQLYQCKMIYLPIEKELRYVFLAPMNDHYPHIQTTEDTNEFIEELKQYQKGSSYRKKHPIAKYEYQNKRDEISKLELEVNKSIKESQELLIEHYNEEINKINKRRNNENIPTIEKSSVEIEEKIVDLLSYLKDKYDVDISITDASIKDKQSNLPVLQIEYVNTKNNKSNIRKLDNSEVIYVMKNYINSIIK